ncbi:hypothetical protein VP01_1365g1 [Puccinia sorghi]|uniref:Uncharacterized protein n=1 Tax=Puccinia sorghi TaxID=27349 RepID=A0A0L6VLT2_9BASI|nr:hypothetical protein VP01_1365g1 [Puccinia sorghi]
MFFPSVCLDSRVIGRFFYAIHPPHSRHSDFLCTHRVYWFCLSLLCRSFILLALTAVFFVLCIIVIHIYIYIYIYIYPHSIGLGFASLSRSLAKQDPPLPVRCLHCSKTSLPPLLSFGRLTSLALAVFYSYSTHRNALPPPHTHINFSFIFSLCYLLMLLGVHHVIRIDSQFFFFMYVCGGQSRTRERTVLNEFFFFFFFCRGKGEICNVANSTCSVVINHHPFMSYLLEFWLIPLFFLLIPKKHYDYSCFFGHVQKALDVDSDRHCGFQAASYCLKLGKGHNNFTEKFSDVLLAYSNSQFSVLELKEPLLVPSPILLNSWRQLAPPEALNEFFLLVIFVYLCFFLKFLLDFFMTFFFPFLHIFPLLVIFY